MHHQIKMFKSHHMKIDVTRPWKNIFIKLAQTMKHQATHSNVMISPLSAIIKLELRVEVHIETDTHRNPSTCGDDSE